MNFNGDEGYKTNYFFHECSGMHFLKIQFSATYILLLV
jgi:hypothetical protein